MVPRPHHGTMVAWSSILAEEDHGTKTTPLDDPSGIELKQIQTDSKALLAAATRLPPRKRPRIGFPERFPSVPFKTQRPVLLIQDPNEVLRGRLAAATSTHVLNAQRVHHNPAAPTGTPRRAMRTAEGEREPAVRQVHSQPPWSPTNHRAQQGAAAIQASNQNDLFSNRAVGTHPDAVRNTEGGREQSDIREQHPWRPTEHTQRAAPPEAQHGAAGRLEITANSTAEQVKAYLAQPQRVPSALEEAAAYLATQSDHFHQLNGCIDSRKDFEYMPNATCRILASNLQQHSERPGQRQYAKTSNVHHRQDSRRPRSQTCERHKEIADPIRIENPTLHDAHTRHADNIDDAAAAIRASLGDLAPPKEEQATATQPSAPPASGDIPLDKLPTGKWDVQPYSSAPKRKISEVAAGTDDDQLAATATTLGMYDDDQLAATATALYAQLTTARQSMSQPRPPNRELNRDTAERMSPSSAVVDVGSLRQSMSQPRPPKRELNRDTAERMSPSSAVVDVGSLRQDYVCGYCDRRKTSIVRCVVGRVRLRCKCGGQQADGKLRLHSTWSIAGSRKNFFLIMC